jgi:glycosyltransferase involved in cell wall biosynthesis
MNGDEIHLYFPNPSMKVAIVHDWLISATGAEKVLKAIWAVFPQAEVYTMVASREICRELGFDYSKIRTSVIQKLPFGVSKHRGYLPLMPFVVEQFDLNGYDIIISSSHAVAKGVLTRSDQLHICYCHTPIRYAWDLYHDYTQVKNLGNGMKSLVAKYILHRIRQWDVLSGFRVDYFLCNSNYVAYRIKKIYGRDAVTIYPNIDVNFFQLCINKKDYYLTVGRLVDYKRTDIIVEAFNRMPSKRLIIIGHGPDFRKIIRKANSNVQVLGYQPVEKLREFMQQTKALLFAADEDFGIVPVEAQACGTPVIAFGKGGVLETVNENRTGVFFHEQNADAIIDAVSRFEELSFDYSEIRKYAEQFSEERFKQKIKEFVLAKYAIHKDS